MAELENPIREAERYLQNARQLLSEKTEKEGDYYNDSKYVRMAGNTALLLYTYESLHKVLEYDGNLRYKIVQDSLEQAKMILDRVEKKMIINKIRKK
jgi:hypothetical protein